MKKSILIGVLAALMLFAFTACENNSSAIGLVDRITAVQNVTYVVGETAKAADFTFTGYTTYGDEVAIDSADVTLGDTTLVKGNNSVTVSYQGAALSSKITVEAVEVTGLTVDASADEAVYYATVTGTSAEKDVTLPTERKIDTTGIVVTAEYDGGSKVLDNDDLTFELASEEVWSSAKDDVVVDVKLGTAATATYKIDIEENLIKSVAMATTEDYVLFSDVADKDALAYAKNLFVEGDETPANNEQPGIYMVATYQGGEVVYVVETDNVEYVTGTSGDETTYGALSAINVDLTKSSVTVTARYKGDEGIVGLANTADVTVDITKDYITDLTVKVSNLVAGINYGDASSTVTEGTPATGTTTFTVTPVMASEEAGTAVAKFYPTADTSKAEADEDYWTFAPADFSSNIAGQRVAFTVTAVIDGETYTKDVQTNLVAAKAN